MRSGITLFHGLLETTSIHTSAPEKDKWDFFFSLFSYCVAPAFWVSLSFTSPTTTCWSTPPPSLQLSFICQIRFPVRSFLLPLSFLLHWFHFICALLCLFFLFLAVQLHWLRVIYMKKQTNKPLFVCVFLQVASVLQGDGPAAGKHQWHHCCFLHVRQQRWQLQPPEQGEAEAALWAGVWGCDRGEDPAL